MIRSSLTLLAARLLDKDLVTAFYSFNALAIPAFVNLAADFDSSTAFFRASFYSAFACFAASLAASFAAFAISAFCNLAASFSSLLKVAFFAFFCGNSSTVVDFTYSFTKTDMPSD